MGSQNLTGTFVFSSLLVLHRGKNIILHSEFHRIWKLAAQ